MSTRSTFLFGLVLPSILLAGCEVEPLSQSPDAGAVQSSLTMGARSSISVTVSSRGPSSASSRSSARRSAASREIARANTISLLKGTKFTINLPSNASTGYKWIVTFDEKIVNLDNEAYRASTSSLIGAAGSQIFTFVGKEKGQTRVTFKYVRPWEKNTAPAEVKEYSVTVR